MMRWAMLLMGSLVWAQTPQFEVATIKPSAPPVDGHTSVRISTDTAKGQLHYSNVTLKDIVGQAYNVQQVQIIGPSWNDSERFDIVAEFAPNMDPKQLPLMLQALLGDRFKLKFHRDTKDLPIYSLVVAKGGPKLQPAETTSGITNSSNRNHAHVTAKVTMARFAEFLTGEAGRPVFDKTGLTGKYDLTLDYAIDSNAIASNDGGASLFTALQEQLGLKLESAKGPVETIVIDHAERKPAVD